MVFCSKYVSDEQATQTLLDNVEGEVLTKPRIIKFTTGQRHKHWHKNCVALGLAAGFLEPLESTSIHLIQSGIIRLLQLFPVGGINKTDVEEFNTQMREEFLFVRDFIVLHYHVTEREDTPFWRHCKTMEIPETLKHRIELFKDSGRIFQKNNDIFAENSWSQVMLGQGLLPKEYHPIVDMMSDEELEMFLNSIKASVNNLVEKLPTHQQFIDHYCKAQII
jgi:tryptophan halogenase